MDTFERLHSVFSHLLESIFLSQFLMSLLITNYYVGGGVISVPFFRSGKVNLGRAEGPNDGMDVPQAVDQENHETTTQSHTSKQNL